MIGGNTKMEVEFSRKYQIVNEVLNAVTHGIAAFLSLICFPLYPQSFALSFHTGNPPYFSQVPCPFHSIG